MIIEIWKDIEGYEGLYQVSNLGRVKSLSRYRNGKNNKPVKINEKILIQMTNMFGYKKLSLCDKNSKIKNKIVHILVAKAFIVNPENKPCINHLSGIKTENWVENLEWCTPKENNVHAIKTGLLNIFGVNSPNSNLTINDVIEIRRKYIPRIYSSRKLGKEYNVSKTSILGIINNKTYINDAVNSGR